MHTLLSTTQLLYFLLIIVLAVERNADANASITLNALSVLRLRIILRTIALISLALDDETTTTSWYETFKDLCEFLGNLLECSLDGFVFALI